MSRRIPGLPSAVRVLYAVTVPITAAAFLTGQLRTLVRRGHSVGLLTSPEPAEALRRTVEASGVTPVPVSMQREIAPRHDLRALAQVSRAVHRFRPQIINVGTPKAALLVGLAAALQRVPLRVYTLHGLRYETATGRQRAVLKLAERLTCACAHQVVAVSPSLRRQAIQDRIVGEHRISVLGSGSAGGVAPITPPEPAKLGELRVALNLPEGVPVIGFVGRLVRDKGVADLLNAFETVLKSYPDAHLLLVGGNDATDPLPPEVHQRLETHPQVVRVGHVAQVAPYYALMTMLALPTYREGLGLVALEAASVGLPVVTTTATGAVDAVVPGHTGLQVPVGDPDALAQALLTLLRQPALAATYGQQGRSWVTVNFSPAHVEGQWLEFYAHHWQGRQLARQHLWKRGVDVLVAGGGLVLLALPLLGLAWMVRIRLGSPVLFAQTRPGLNGQPFTMYKFRTMTDARDAAGQLLPDAERLTAFGRLLRATSLDELPELWNVLRGDMSLVGPRPLLMEYLPLYSEAEARRHEVRPGITGWAQVNGRNAIDWATRFTLDVWYVEHVSPLLDARILLRTLLKVIRREGISAAGEATMTRFTGRQSAESGP